MPAEKFFVFVRSFIGYCNALENEKGIFKAGFSYYLYDT